jgi:CRISPR/Cas system-associated exonuclease Cas4 (RecB family)
MVCPTGDWNLRVWVPEIAPELLTAPPAAEEQSELELLQPPAITGQQDTNATVTAIARFANCPREYYLGQYLGYEGRRRTLESADSEEEIRLSAGDLGTQVHALLANKAVPKPDPEAVRLAEVFRKSALGRRTERATRIEREFDFLMAVEDVAIRGQVDLWFEDGNELIVVDYKTDSVSASEARHRARDYAVQLRLYAMALERLTGRTPSHAWLHFLRPDMALEVDLTPSLIENPEQIVRDFQEAQSKLEFPLNEGPHCRRCPFFRDLCPAPLELKTKETGSYLLTRSR